ncbi:MAG TPA: AAA family ATPase [Gemmatimonadaceae bacterium]|nr:AAA family ATPase [Gemmatimonadaceae bacterium]
MPLLVLRLCGDVVLRAPDGAPIQPPLGAKTLGLLAFLTLEPGAHRRERVTALLWGDFPEEKARASLRQALTHLRDALGDDLRIDRSTIELTGRLECDATEFLRLATTDASAALAIDVPRFLEGVSIRNCQGFAEWAEEKRAVLTTRYAGLLASSARDALARRAWTEARRFAERWHRLDVLADEPIAVLVEAQFLAGDRAGALAAYARHVARLAAEAERTPSRTLATLAARIEHTAAAKAATPRATEGWYERAPSFDASLVGRGAEWERIKSAWESIDTQGGRVVVIEGEPGVGKTRLADDFLRWVTSRGGIVLRGRGYDARGGAPYGAVIEALRSTLDAPGLAGVDAQWLAEVARVLPELRRRFAQLPDVAANAPADGWRLFEAVSQVLLALSEERPLVVMIDDLHWCDADSCALVHFLVRRLAESRILWCATFTLGEVERDAPAARLGRALRAARGAAHVTLAPLSEEDIWQLVRELGRVDAPTGGRRLAARIHEVTAGNPFYVIELLKTLFAQDILSVDPDTKAWIVSPSVVENGGFTYAATVHEAIADRIECLPDEIHAVLISIAAAGRGCRAEVLSYVHGISRLHAAMLADALVERHLVIESDGVYHCAHPTIAAVVRARLTTSRRREVHRALALTLEQLLPARDRTDFEVGEIARHADQAGDRTMTYRYALLAADAAVTRCAFDDGLSWLDLASGSAVSTEESEAVDRITSRVLAQAGWREAPPLRARASLATRRVEPADLDLPLRV